MIPKTFSNERERIIQSYDYVDLASGTGYIDYYLIESETSAGKDYHLTTRRDYSNSVSISATAATNDYDYDLTPFVLPQEIEGTALISLAVHSTGGNNPTWTVELYRYNGTTETQIGSTITFTQALSAAKMLYLPITITRTHFKKGEILRLRVVQANPSVTTSSYGIDPANRTDGSLTITTTSRVSIPFKINN